MKKAYLPLLIGVLVPLISFSQPENINISNTSSFEGEPTLAVNPVNQKNIVIGWMALDLSTGFKVAIKSSASFDGGTNWKTPVRVNDDPTGNGIGQDMVWVSYDMNNKLVITWRDRRNGTGTGFYQSSDTYAVVSSDNGLTFQRNVRLSNMTAPFDAILEQKGNDFLSCQSVHDTIYAAWGDVRSGHLNIFFTKTSDSTGLGIQPILGNGNENKLLSVYPNPASGKLYISFLKDQPRQIELKIYNENGEELIGREIFNNASGIIIDISRLVRGGYYLIAMNHAEILYSDKIIVK